MKWFRMYIDILDDPKIDKMKPKTFKVFIFLLAFCSELEQNGIIFVTKNRPKWRLRIRKRDWNNAINELNELNIIDIQGDKIHILNWNKRQYKSDDVTARVKRYRKKKETLHETLHETPPETETETETKTEKKRKKRKEYIYSPEFLKFWEIYPKRDGKKVGKQLASEQFKKLDLENGDYELLMKAVKNYGGQKYPKDAVRFLKNNFWQDWIEEADEVESLTDEERRIAEHNKKVREMYGVDE